MRGVPSQLAGPRRAAGRSSWPRAACRAPCRPTQWRSAVQRTPAQVFEAAQLLALGGLHRPRCAETAWRAMLDWDTTTGDLRARYQFGALLGLHGLLIAEGRGADARALLEGDTLFRASYRGQLYILGALAGAGFEREADAFAEGARRTYRSSPDNLSSLALWFLGSWIAHRGGAAEAQEMSERILRNAAAGSPRRDSLLAASLRARATLARGDSAEAIRQLRALTPTATSHQDLAWNPWGVAWRRASVARPAAPRPRAGRGSA